MPGSEADLNGGGTYTDPSSWPGITAGLAERLLDEKLPDDALFNGMKGWRTTETTYASVAYQSTTTNQWKTKRVRKA